MTPWTVAYQTPLFMEFSRQEYWSGLPFSSPGDLPDPGIEPRSPALQADSLQSEPPGKPLWKDLATTGKKRKKIWDPHKVKWKSLSHVWLCDPMDYTVHGILQARILEWVVFPFSRRSSQLRDWMQVSCIAGRFFTSWATREAHSLKDKNNLLQVKDKLYITTALQVN